MASHENDSKVKKPIGTRIGEKVMAVVGGAVGLFITILSINANHTGGAVTGIVTVICCGYLFYESKKDTW
jgi:hypothetical protein